MGIAVQFNLNSSTTADVAAAQIAAKWRDAVHATRGADVVIQTVYNAGAATDRLMLTSDGRLTLPTAGQVNPVVAELPTLGAVSMYVKGSKIVFAFNNAGTITYATWDMTQAAAGAAGVWISSTTAP
jgi:hypothetical protein